MFLAIEIDSTGCAYDCQYFCTTLCEKEYLLTKWTILKATLGKLNNGQWVDEDTNCSVDYGYWPCPEMPEFDVYCGNCESLLYSYVE